MFTKAAQTSPKMRHAQQRVFGWKPSLRTWLIALFLLAGTAVVFHTTVATWFSASSQAAFITQYLEEVRQPGYDAREHLEAVTARTKSGTAEVGLAPYIRYPIGSEISQVSELTGADPAEETDVLGRIQVQDIDLDLPIFEGVDEASLSKGVAHLTNSSLPIGGETSNAVLTAYRGYPTASMFNRIDELEPGQDILLSSFGEVLTYKVNKVLEVSADQRQDLTSETDNDQLTLVTSSPLVDDSPRIVVVAERVVPTSAEDLARASEQPAGPGFPQWLLVLLGAYGVIGLYVWRAGYTDARQRRIRRAQNKDQKRQERKNSGKSTS